MSWYLDHADLNRRNDVIWAENILFITVHSSLPNWPQSYRWNFHMRLKKMHSSFISISLKPDWLTKVIIDSGNVYKSPNHCWPSSLEHYASIILNKPGMMMSSNGNIFGVTALYHQWGEFIGHRLKNATADPLTPVAWFIGGQNLGGVASNIHVFKNYILKPADVMKTPPLTIGKPVKPTYAFRKH